MDCGETASSAQISDIRSPARAEVLNGPDDADCCKSLGGPLMARVSLGYAKTMQNHVPAHASSGA